jgi:hypothetical protein
VSAGRGGALAGPDLRPGAAIRPRRAYRRGVSEADVFGPYRGGTYTRAYLTMFWLLGAAAIALELWAHGRWGAIVVLVVVTAMGATVLVGTAQSVLSPQGLRLVLLRRWVPWTEVAEVLAPEPGDSELRLRLADGTVLTAKGVPASVGPALRAALGRQ